MNFKEQVERLQKQANDLAIQEGNLREQIAPMEGLKHQLAEVGKAKHQTIGALVILRELAAEETTQKATKNSGVDASEFVQSEIEA